ncbi:hypothetical protein [Jiella sonneratiae]|uniref:Prepilin-type N-terminal cleavage/methylation domain-containing protein n=1 Tax=Jiella sonneratiae TaxID=2816856 RepID=A0ABS3J3Z4_9HYPH|nr:hypothetical protein [Jiella sonneratiae]MBO0904395.1 hypothetical protein [Jiella sonneratiae]
MTCCTATGEQRLPDAGDRQRADFRPIGGDRRHYRRPFPVLELMQLAAAVILCTALICGFVG